MTNQTGYRYILSNNKTKYFRLWRYNKVWVLSECSLSILWVPFEWLLSGFWVLSECLLHALWVILKSSWSHHDQKIKIVSSRLLFNTFYQTDRQMNDDLYFLSFCLSQKFYEDEELKETRCHACVSACVCLWYSSNKHFERSCELLSKQCQCIVMSISVIPLLMTLLSG